MHRRSTNGQAAATIGLNGVGVSAPVRVIRVEHVERAGPRVDRVEPFLGRVVGELFGSPVPTPPVMPGKPGSCTSAPADVTP